MGFIWNFFHFIGGGICDFQAAISSGPERLLHMQLLEKACHLSVTGNQQKTKPRHRQANADCN